MHASALGLTWACSACTTVPGKDEIHQIRAHWLPSCPPPAGDDLAQIDLEALGDFDPSPETREVLGEGDGTTLLVVPAVTRAVTARATDGSRAWTGFGVVTAQGHADFGLFPRGAACRVAGDHGDGQAYPSGSAGGEALGYHPGAGTVLVAGGSGPSSVATGALSFDVATGEVTVVEPEDGLRARRALSAITPFGDALLVSGGLDPAGAPLGTADVFDPATRAFEEDLVELEGARGRHAAVELASGETLLVGGVGPLGEALGTLEALSPETRKYRISGLADLANPRLDPVVLRLDDDHILVAGGTDAALAPIDSVEWLEADASRAARDVLVLPGEAPTLGRAFVAMPGGGALAVGGCTLNVGPLACDAPCESGRGCPSSEVLWLTRDGAATLPDLERPVAKPRLVEAEQGRPFLLVQTPSGTALRRFDPWLGRFLLPEGDTPVPSAGARFLSTDPGLFLWLEPDADGSSLQAFRHGTRNEYSALVAPLLLGSTAGISPDRAPGTGVALDLSPSGGGGAVLSEPGASLVVTDTTYADVFLTLDLNVGVEGNVMPVVWLGTRAFGGTACPWPGAGDAARVERRGGTVALRVGERVRECEGPSGRVDVRLEAPDRAVHVRSVTVRRSPGE